MAERKPTYYYVQCACGNWDIAVWLLGHWTMCGDVSHLSDEFFKAIGPQVPDYVEPAAAADTQESLGKTIGDRLTECADRMESQDGRSPPVFDLVSELRDREIPWSRATFGEGRRTIAITNHIRKELDEILANPTDVTEWCDVAILALDGAWRSGHTAEEVVAALFAKLVVTRTRTYPKPVSEDEPSEHDRNPSPDHIAGDGKMVYPLRKGAAALLVPWERQPPGHRWEVNAQKGGAHVYEPEDWYGGFDVCWPCSPGDTIATTQGPRRVVEVREFDTALSLQSDWYGSGYEDGEWTGSRWVWWIETTEA